MPQANFALERCLSRATGVKDRTILEELVYHGGLRRGATQMVARWVLVKGVPPVAARCALRNLKMLRVRCTSYSQGCVMKESEVGLVPIYHPAFPITSTPNTWTKMPPTTRPPTFTHIGRRYIRGYRCHASDLDAGVTIPCEGARCG